MTGRTKGPRRLWWKALEYLDRVSDELEYRHITTATISAAVQSFGYGFALGLALALVVFTRWV